MPARCYSLRFVRGTEVEHVVPVEVKDCACPGETSRVCTLCSVEFVDINTGRTDLRTTADAKPPLFTECCLRREKAGALSLISHCTCPVLHTTCTCGIKCKAPQSQYSLYWTRGYWHLISPRYFRPGMQALSASPRTPGPQCRDIVPGKLRYRPTRVLREVRY